MLLFPQTKCTLHLEEPPLLASIRYRKHFVLRRVSCTLECSVARFYFKVLRSSKSSPRRTGRSSSIFHPLTANPNLLGSKRVLRGSEGGLRGPKGEHHRIERKSLENKKYRFICKRRFMYWIMIK